MLKKGIFSQGFAVLFFAALVSWAGIGIRDAAARSRNTSIGDRADIEAVEQVELDLGNFQISGDFDRYSQLWADDLAIVGSSGNVVNKTKLLSTGFPDKLVWFETGPIDIQVLGNVALGQGIVREKRNNNGKLSSPQLVWGDLLEKRAGKWVVVRSFSGDLPDSVKAVPDPGAAEQIKKLEQDIGEAMVAVDLEKLNQVYADDFATIGSSGKLYRKEDLLGDFKSGKYKLVSFELGPVNVQAFGDVAVAQAGVKEKTIEDGKDISRQAAFLDLLRKREGKWVVVRTLGARVS
jgi:ketosteroid isomerase-like protein